MIKTGKTYNVTEEEIKKFLGICIIMGNLKFPRLLLQWKTKCCVPIIHETMMQSQFLLIRTNFAATSCGEPPNNTNKYRNVWPVVGFIRNECRALEKEELKNWRKNDTIPCPTRRHVRNKPNPVGIESFFWCGKSGRADDFALYQRAGTEISQEFLLRCDQLKIFHSIKISKSF